MKRHTNLWSSIISFENLHKAFQKARKGKNGRAEVAWFHLELERNLFRLQHELTNRLYIPGKYRQFKIYDRKPRNISAAPFRDRVVHHALMRVVEPLLDRSLHPGCFACRKGMGVHAAVDQYQQASKRYAYVMKLDVKKYFPSLDHDVLKQKIRHTIKDVDVLWLFDRIIDHSPFPIDPPLFLPGDDLVSVSQRRAGLPIGNLTSQFLGNLYLTKLDYFITQKCAIKAYVRYVDDMVLLSNDKQQLWQTHDAIAEFLLDERLLLNESKTLLTRTKCGIEFLGYRVFPKSRRLRRENGYRFRRRLKQHAAAFAEGRIELSEVTSSVMAWLGHTRHADSQNLCESILSSVSFVRGTASVNDGASASRRLLEQQSAEPALCEPQQEPAR